jgi:hypothetical protein
MWEVYGENAMSDGMVKETSSTTDWCGKV